MAMFTGHLLTVTQHVLFTSLGKLKSIQECGGHCHCALVVIVVRGNFWRPLRSDHTCLARQKRQKREKRALQLDHPPTEERGGTRNTTPSAQRARARARACGHACVALGRRDGEP